MKRVAAALDGAMVVAMVVLLAMLAACSPRYDWRQVSLADGQVRAMFPDKPRTSERELDFEGHALSFSLTSASVNDVLFSVGYAALPQALQDDAAARKRLVRQTLASLYQNLGSTPPAALPADGERFTVLGSGTGKGLRLEAMVWATPQALIEGMVIGQADRLPDAQISEFMRELAPDQRPPFDEEAAAAGS